MRTPLLVGLVSWLFAGIASAALLTDVTVFSTNSEGNNWNGLIWNTQGKPADVPDRYNLYLTGDSLSVAAPTFVNHFNDAQAQISIPLVSGTNTFAIYGEGVGSTFDPLQHFVLNLYFGHQQSVPAISGVQNLAGNDLEPAGHPNGLDLYGTAGTPEAGTLVTEIGGQQIVLTAFDWRVGTRTDGRDVVWSTWANDAPYGGGSGTADYYGTFTLQVSAVPLPGTGSLVGLALALLLLGRRNAGGRVRRVR